MLVRGKVQVAALIAAGLIIASPAAWNGYPLVFADTGTYLGQAILLYLGWDRPPTYSLFLHALHWRLSLWPVPIVQGLIVAHLLSLVLRAMDQPGPVALLGWTVLLTVATGLPWFAAQLMPDVFTGLLILAIWLLGFGRARLSPAERRYIFLLATGATAMHLAHLPLVAGLAIIGGALAWHRRGIVAGLAMAGRLAAPLGLAMLVLVGFNVLGHGRVSVSPFGSVFLAARLIDDGPGLRTLDARCPDAEWRICALRERLPMHPNDFLWLPDAPLRGDLGGGKAWAPEASAIVGATLLREPVAVVRAFVVNFLQQARMLATGDGLEPWRNEPGPEPIIASHFPRELDAFRDSRQWTGELQPEVRRLSALHEVLAWVGLLLLPVLAWLQRRHAKAMALCTLVLAGGIGNAMVTGGLSGPNERYQARIAWLFAFTPALVLAGRMPSALSVRHPVERRDAA